MIQELLKQAWLARGDQKIEETVAIAAEISSSLAQVTEGPEYQAVESEFALLKASILRARGEIDLSDQAIRAIEEPLIRESRPLPGRLLLERGLNRFYRGDYYKSLEDFLVASKRANELPPIAILQAKVNAVLCSEYLNLPAETLAADVNERFAALPKDLYLGFQTQWNAYIFRREFAAGRILELKSENDVAWSQARHQISYCQKIPYLRLSRATQEPARELAPQAYLQSYRARTLRGDLHPDDLTCPKLTEVIERIYLWTWYWIGLENFPLEKILALIEALPEDLPARVLTVESRLELRNSLRWILLFEPHREREFSSILEAIGAGSLNSSASLPLEIENLAILALRERLRPSATDAAKLLRDHLLWNSPLFHWKDFFASLDQEGGNGPLALSRLRERVLDKESGASAARKAKIKVDLRIAEVHLRDPNKKIVSEAGAKALALLQERGHVSCEEFVLHAFNLHGYDSLDHDPRIFNLLARIREWLPKSIMIRKRGDRVIASGDWSQVRIEGDLNRKLKTFRAPDFNWQSARAVPLKRKETELFVKLGDAPFTRRELEKKFGKSRPSTNRLIEKWLRDGMVRAVGKGPSRQYVMVPESISNKKRGTL